MIESGMIDWGAFEAFHFLRPLWLVLLPVFPLIAWVVRRATARREQTARYVTPHLARALTVGGRDRSGFQPVDGVVLVGLLATLAAAGPSWTRVVNPLAPDAPPMVIALEVSESMLAIDVQPSRLERARHKVRDLLERRGAAPTALVAYAGTAHLVLPLTEDPAILRRFVEGLAPPVMPRDGRNGTEALDVARRVLEAADEAGVILFVGGGFDPADLDAFRENREQSGPSILALVLGTQEGGAIQDAKGGFASDSSGRRRVARVDPKVLDRFAGEAKVEIFRATIDASDVRRIDRASQADLLARQQQDDDFEWEDRGWMTIWPAALLGLLWFRRGWSMRWSRAALVIVGLVAAAPPAEAGTLEDLLFTPDQQARWAYEHLRFSEAGDLFEDATWRGYALYEAGRYLEAADAFGRVLGPDALFAMGNALVKGREYRRAIDAYEQALAEDPDHASARTNLLLAQVILAKLTEERADTDTGDGSEGADEVRFDNESKQGTTISIDRGGEMSLESEEAWMRTVDPGIAEFLRLRFEHDLEVDRQSGSSAGRGRTP